MRTPVLRDSVYGVLPRRGRMALPSTKYQCDAKAVESVEVVDL